MSCDLAKKLCPTLVTVPKTWDKPGEVARQLWKILYQVDSNFLRVGYDEAYLDITSLVESRKKVRQLKHELFIKIRMEKSLPKK